MKTENLKEGIRLNDLIEKHKSEIKAISGGVLVICGVMANNNHGYSELCTDEYGVELICSALIEFHNSEISLLQSKFDAL